MNDTDWSIRRHGMPVSRATTLFIELATVLTEDDLIAVGDALILDPYQLDPMDPRPWVGLEELRAFAGSSASRGARLARRAAARVRQGAESREETLLRLLLVAAGFPEPELQVELFDARGFIGRFDMVYREARVIVEYDGDQHRTSTRQYERDMRRLERAAHDDWTVVRIRARGLYAARAETLQRVRTAFAR